MIKRKNIPVILYCKKASKFDEYLTKFYVEDTDAENPDNNLNIEEYKQMIEDERNARVA